MKLNELAESIAFKLGKDTDYGFQEMLKADIISARATAIKTEFDKTKIIPQNLIQTIYCIPLIRVYSGCVDCKSDELVYRTLFKIPKLIMMRTDSPYVEVSTPFKGKSKRIIPIINQGEVSNIAYTRYSKNSIVCYFRNDYLEFVNSRGMESVDVASIYANPLDVETVRLNCTPTDTTECACEDCTSSKRECFNYNTSNCIDADGDLIIEDEYVQLIKILIYKELGVFQEPAIQKEIDVNQ
jgi:hypothetical protein